jgi:hypothetical protein
LPFPFPFPLVLRLADPDLAASTISSISGVEIHTLPFNAMRFPFFRSTRAPRTFWAFSFSLAVLRRVLQREDF